MQENGNQHLLRVHYFPEVFSPAECQQIMALEGYTEPSRISSEVMIQRQIRNSTSTFIPNTPENQWITDRLLSHLQVVNEKYYRFRLNWLSPLQVISYGENGFYDWHLDMGGDTPELSTRKLSLITILSHPSEYEGGTLKIIAGVEAQAVPNQEQGTLIFFPAYLLHKVEPVRRGLRKTLVLWAHGPAFS